ncbi:MFS transporter [Kibdelosporangium philippinense]|uniref:MFS transporter n=1 Tax=Kibdelosporangium philippinense TaxID=211113 RepID=A0ABS8ZND0_9PSEU|nr:MDR family MFS transporter [Kibdelosporangium philippinense]MCE7009244.1 MFS transporter [Kibdelosporangium philippinense]
MSEQATAAAGAPASRAGALSHRQILTILSGLMLGMFLAALDQTIMASAMKTIADQLHGQTIQAWATTAYLITATISTPLYGKLSDIFGRKPMYLTAISVFLIGSLLSGIATSMYELAAYRAVQGLGAGGLMSLAFAIIADITSPLERSRYTGYFMGVWGLSSVGGPLIGGLFAGLDTFLGITGWRWVFLLNVPIALIALVVVSRVLNVPHTKVSQRIDFWGASTLTIGLVPLLIVAEQGREWGWDSVASIAMYVTGVVGLVAFVFVERWMGDAALLPMRLFRRPVFALTNSINFIMGIGMFGMMMSLPLYLQIVKGATPTESGLMTLPMTFGILASATVSGRITSRTGRYRIFPIIGLAATTVALFLFAQIGTDTALWQTMLIMTLAGAGLGLCMQSLLLAVQADAPAKDMGVATSSATFFRSIGGTVGTAVFLSILFGIVADRIAAARAAASLPPLPAGAGGLDLNNTAFINQLPPQEARPVLDGFASSLDTVFMVGGIVLIVAFALIWFLKEVPLTNKSGLQRAASEEDTAAPVAAMH